MESVLLDQFDVTGAPVGNGSSHARMVPKRRLTNTGNPAQLAGGLAASAFCLYVSAVSTPGKVDLAKALCIGVEINIGHSPLMKSAQYSTPSIPLIGSPSIQWVLEVENLVWSRLGMLDGGFGIKLTDMLTIDLSTSLSRYTLAEVGLEFEFDVT